MRFAFGPEHQGMVVYLVLEDLRQVDILKVHRLD